jgi:hypothetical protein
MGGEMKIKRKLRTLTGVLLILMFTSGAQAATMIIDKTDSMRGRKTEVEFLVLFDGPVMAFFRSLKIIGVPILVWGMLKFQSDPAISPVDVNKVDAGKAVGGGSVLSIPRLSDLGLSKLKVSDEPVPTIALLILVGLIALIALKGRRR